MDLTATLLFEHSRQQSLKLVEWVGDNPKRFDELMQLYFSNQKKISQRTAMAISYIFEQKPDFFLPYISKMVAQLDDDIHDALIRCTFKVLTLIEIPEKIESEVLQKAYQFFSTGNYPPAIKVHAMQTIYNIAQKYPELKLELKASIEMQIPNGSTGFKNRAFKLLNKLNSQKSFVNTI